MNNKQISIINIEGSTGVGCSTHVHLLAQHYQKQGYQVKINNFENDLLSTLLKIQENYVYLMENPDTILINDGSILKLIARDLGDGLTNEQITEKYNEVLHYYNKLDHKFGIVNIVMIPENIEMCQKRLDLQDFYMGNVNKRQLDDLREQELIISLLALMNNPIAINLSFKTFQISEKDSIIKVQENLLKLLNEKSLP